METEATLALALREVVVSPHRAGRSCSVDAHRDVADALAPTARRLRACAAGDDAGRGPAVV